MNNIREKILETIKVKGKISHQDLASSSWKRGNNYQFHGELERLTRKKVIESFTEEKVIKNTKTGHVKKEYAKCYRMYECHKDTSLCKKKIQDNMYAYLLYNNELPKEIHSEELLGEIITALDMESDDKVEVIKDISKELGIDDEISHCFIKIENSNCSK
jgi:RecG-like helicase